MKKRYMALAIGAAGIGFAASYTFAVLRCVHNALAAITEPQPSFPELQRKLMVRHFHLPQFNSGRTVQSEHFFEHPFAATIEHYRVWLLRLSSRTICHIAASDVAGAKTGLVGPKTKGASTLFNAKLRCEGSRLVLPSLDSCFRSELAAAIRTACPSSKSLARLASFKEFTGLVPAGYGQPIPTPFEAQQTYLCSAMVGLHAPNDWQLRYAVKKFVRAALK